MHAYIHCTGNGTGTGNGCYAYIHYTATITSSVPKILSRTDASNQATWNADESQLTIQTNSHKLNLADTCKPCHC